MQPPFNEARTWDIPADTNIDEAIELIQGDGYEYISLMGFLRKTDPGMVRYLLQNDSEESEGRSKYKAAQLFFQAKKPEQVIFTSLKNEALGIEAKTSPEMVKLATDYYRNLYSSPPQASWNDLKRYLKPIRPRLSGLQRQELERPFTLKELEHA
ncbi:hypothetical protein OXX79_014019, partial [Metschnikowia pulcherrima]